MGWIWTVLQLLLWLPTSKFVLFFSGQVKEVLIPVWTLGEKRVFPLSSSSHCAGWDLHVLASGVCQRFVQLCQWFIWRKGHWGEAQDSISSRGNSTLISLEA